MKSNNVALKYFVTLLEEGKLEYMNGQLWKRWELRREWLDTPKRAEKLTSNGYYILRTVNKEYENPLYVMAHRVVWSYFNGGIPDGMEINHKNGVKTDNRIENLELVTSSENTKHAVETGLLKAAKGLKNGRAKLSDGDVTTIKELLQKTDLKQGEIADFFGVRPNQVSRIKTGSRRNELMEVQGLSFSEYQFKSTRTMHELPLNMALCNYAMGLAGEAAEVTDYLKKVVFHGHELDKEKVAEELGDVLFYVAAISTTLGISMDDIAIGNVEKLIKRYPKGFNEEDSQKRVDVNE